MEEAYLDNAATTALDPRVLAAMMPWLGARFGNPSSRHRRGVAAARALDEARQAIGRALGVPARGVVLTSGGTEANALAVLGAARARAAQGRHVLVGPTEHPSVRDAARRLAEEGFEVETGRLARGGALDVDDLARRARPDTVLAALMLVQNEAGTIYPVREALRAVRARAPHAHLHVDAVQAVGKLLVSLPELGADSLSISGHKVHGPQGAGALVLAVEAGGARLTPLFHGGGQERGLRSGTPAVAALVGLGEAVRLAEAEREPTAAHLAGLRERLTRGLAHLAGAVVLEPGREPGGIAPGVLAVLLPGAPAEVHLHHLDAHGVQAGSGSACQAQKQATSPSLAALVESLGHPPAAARSCLRFSLARTTTAAEVDRAVEALQRVALELSGVRR